MLGLSLFAAAQRVKEIGVRKVLGASIPDIIILLSREFIWLVLLSNCIAFPVAWWLMHDWLNGYAYRTGINWTVFALAGIGALAIALLTVSYITIRAALANPIKSLRTE